MNKVEKIKAEIERLKQQFMSQADNFHSLGMEEKENHCAILASHLAALIRYIDSLEEDPVSNDLEEAARKAATWHSRVEGEKFFPNDYQKFIAGAQWQKQQDQSTIELAEDHAYLAGQEKIIAKACDWLLKNDSYAKPTEVLVRDFKKAMEE